MRKTLIVLASLAFIVACGSNSGTKEEKKESSTTATDPNDITQHPDYKAGLALEAGQDCATCHRIDEKLQGPSYRDIAAKYAGSDTAIDYLARKIKEGGNGVWGEIRMTPHPGLTDDQLKTLAKYVLLYKK